MSPAEKKATEMGAAEPLRLISVKIKAFKAIDDLAFDVGNRPITLIIGPNGAGKTSALQALGFLRYFVQGRSKAFFDDHGWPPSTVVSHVRQKRTSRFGIICVFRNPRGMLVLWAFAFDINSGKTAGERISILNDVILELQGGTIKFGKWDNQLKSIEIDGSILSTIKISDHPDTEHRQILESVRAWAEGITSLELLSPAAMRRMARGKVTDIGVRGEQLGAFLASLPMASKDRITARLARFYPHLSGLVTKAKRAGWIDFKIAESFAGKKMSVGAEHVSDGFLRLLALAAIPEFPKSTSLVLLDEAENGIDPLILPDFLELITQESSAQIIMTTHSPILVNRFPPEAVHLVCRAEEGPTIGARLVDIPKFEEELEYRGAGEIWAHSSLSRITELVRDANRAREKEKAEKVTS